MRAPRQRGGEWRRSRALAITALAITALASTASEAEAAAPESSEGVDEAADKTPSERPVLLLMAEADELGAALARALETELNDVDVELEVVEMVPAVELRDRIEAAEALVHVREALGLIWIEARADGLVIHLVVADAGMLRRPVVGLDDAGAAIEAAAVIVRYFALDLLAGRPIGLTRFVDEPELEPDPEPGPGPDPEPDPGPGPEPDPDPGPDEPSLEAPPDVPEPPAELLGDRGRFRLQAGYVGQTWIRERAWDNGVEVDAGWRFRFGLHLGLGVAVTPAFEAELKHPLNLGVAQLQIRRYPLALGVGYQRVWSRARVGLDAQLRIVGELVTRRLFDPTGVTPNLDDRLLVIPALEPRVVVDYWLIPQLALFVGLGLRASLVRVDYAIEYVDEQGEVIASERPISPRVVVPVALAGLDMFF